ncbi:MAG: amino acid--tRNA ligase-related protein, partial [Planctomycetota bacterium]
MTAPVATIENLARHIGQTVTLRGWLHNKSSKGKLHFVQLRDGSGFVQCVVFQKSVPPELFEAVGKAGQESSLVLEGEVVADPRAPGGCEVQVKDGRVLQSVEGFPITPKEHGPDFLLSQRHLWLRSKRQWALLRIRDAVVTALRGFFDQRGFVCMDSPMFTPSACEGTSTLFEVGYFDRKAYLTQSGQLYAEASAMAFGKVYCFGPTFRAEKSKTRRHLTEFWMLEPEVAFATLEDILELAEDMLVHVAAEVLARRKIELAVLERDLTKLAAIQKPFPRITYDDAVKTLQAKGLPIEWGGDFGGP